MDKALFTRKAVDIDELKRRTGQEHEKNHFVIEKVVELSEKEFDEFADDLLEDKDFIRDNIESMYVDPNDIWHCILVKAKGRNDGVSIQSSGYSYVRYGSYIPDYREVANRCITK